MSNEVTIPLLPCGSIDEIADFYGALGFDVTYRQQRPNPSVALRREDLNLHFFGLPDFDPEQSYGSCLVLVADTGDLYRAFADGMRAKYGKVLVAGIPRMTRPRKRKNAGGMAGFTVIDPGGNWIRIFPSGASGSDEETLAEPSADDGQPLSKLARALENAVVIGESKGDEQQAAKILDSTIAREQESAPPVDLVEALVYRAELAVRLEDGARAEALLARVSGIELSHAERQALEDALANATELARILGSGPVSRT